jgi:MoCo/4Fe-4S cofactor protein with predicted Tat translocation signal
MSNKKYWLGIETLNNNTKELKAHVQNEFREELPFEDAQGILDAKTPRRDFLKYLGFSTAAATLAASCEMPVRKAISWANKPNNITPGVANFYASTFVDGGEAIPVLVKSREARPIKIEGNPDSKLTEGATTARVQASILSLYDTARLKTPLIGGKEATWEAIDQKVNEAMTAAAGSPVYLITSTINSPTVLNAINAFTTKFSNVKHVMYDAMSYSGLLDAAALTTGKRAIPHFHFDKAQTIVSIGADFLGTWLHPAAFAKAYSKGRKINKETKTMSKHYQIEGAMTITGGSADERATCRPSEFGKAAVALLGAINGTTANTGSKNLDKLITAAAADLKKGNGLVVSDSNDSNVQQVVMAINAAIGAFGNTVNTTTTHLSKQGNDKAMAEAVAAIKAGAGVMIYDCNPVYDHADGAALGKAIKAAKVSVSFNDRLDETTQQCTIVAPTTHWLESWGDAEPVSGYVSLQQPTIAPLFKTRPFAENLIKWSGTGTSYSEAFMTYWKGKFGGDAGFDAAIQKGILEPEAMPNGGSYSGSPAAAIAVIAAQPASKGMEVVLYEKVGIGRGGVWSNNPWLQEMPDPITKCTWDNYVAMSPAKAQELGAELTDLNEVQRDKFVFNVKLANGKSLDLPVAVVPGMHNDVVAIAVGYGRDAGAGKAARASETQGGKNAYALTTYNPTTGTVVYNNNATVTNTKKTYQLAITQTHHSYEQRDTVVQESTLAEYAKDPLGRYNHRMEHLHHYVTDMDEAAATIAAKAEGAAHGGAKHEGHQEAGAHAEQQHVEVHGEHASIDGQDHDIEKLYRKNGTLYPVYESPGVKWGMSIDLSTCTGCGSCTIACQAENNVSVVGKEQVMKVHDMHWLRIDRYYTSTSGNEMDSDSIQTVFMPMLCQHCDNAPCENVCPVNATNHSTEGFNQMTYNRCIGTRYCANNCPFKVRRFNWRDWNGADSFEDNLFEDGYRDDINSDLTRMVLNPDVTVRSRGVIEKCSFCVQRTQSAKTKAKSENRTIVESDINSACAQACPTNAIIFGNVNDPNSTISKVRNTDSKERVFYALEELHVLPNVNYLYKVRNSALAGNPVVEEAAHGAPHGAEHDEAKKEHA